jgi:hypothetical protein
MLTSADITRLLAQGGARAKRGNPSNARNKWYDGTEWHTGKPPTASVVKYEGRAGSMRRSRKGATVRNTNGRRYLVGQYETPTVVAYKVTP